MKIQLVFLCLLPILTTVKSNLDPKNVTTENSKLSTNNKKVVFPSMKKIYVTEKPLTTEKLYLSTENVKVAIPTMKKFTITEKPATTVKVNIPRRTMMPKFRPKPIETRTEYVYKEPIKRRPLMKSAKLITEPKIPHPKREFSIVYRYVPTTENEIPFTPFTTPKSINLDLSNNNIKVEPSTQRSLHKAKSLSLTEKLNMLKASKKNDLKEVAAKQKEKERIEAEITTKKFSEDGDFNTEISALETLVDEKSSISGTDVKLTTPVSTDMKDEELIFVQALTSKPRESNSEITSEASSSSSRRRR